MRRLAKQKKFSTIFRTTYTKNMLTILRKSVFFSDFNTHFFNTCLYYNIRFSCCDFGFGPIFLLSFAVSYETVYLTTKISLVPTSLTYYFSKWFEKHSENDANNRRVRGFVQRTGRTDQAFGNSAGSSDKTASGHSR